jgi:molybdopterin-guanine dinucleotide biosynthesis protein A
MGGVDKALLEVAGATMLDRVLACVLPHCEEIVVVGPPRATAASGVRFTTEMPRGGGPVPAVAAGLAFVPGAGIVVVLAVDLPLLTPAETGELLTVLADPAVEAVAALDHRGLPNPLLAAYRAGSLRAVVRGLGPGTAASALLPPATATVDLGPAGVLNVNGPADIERAEQALTDRELRDR